MHDRIVLLENEAATRRWAGALAAVLARQGLAEQAFVVHLSGDLGAGKTTLVRGILRGFGYRGAVKSPSFALLEPYNSLSIPIYHFDLYRFSSPDQWFDAGFDDILASPGLKLVEWPEQAAGALPAPDLHLRLQAVGEPGHDPAASHDPAADDARLLAVTAHSEAGRRCLNDPLLARPSPGPDRTGPAGADAPC